MKSRLRLGFSAVCASKGSLKIKALANCRQNHVFAKIDFRIMFDISAGRAISVQPHSSDRADRVRSGWLGRFFPVFSPDDLAHEFDRELGVLVGEFDPDCFAILDGQLMT